MREPDSMSASPCLGRVARAGYNIAYEAERQIIPATGTTSAGVCARSACGRSENEFGQIGVLRERADLVADIGAVDLDESTLRPVRGGKADLFQQPFEDCVQA